MNTLSLNNKPNLIPTQGLDYLRHKLKKKQLQTQFASEFLPEYFSGELAYLFYAYKYLKVINASIITIDTKIKLFLLPSIIATKKTLWVYNKQTIILSDFDTYPTVDIYRKIKILNSLNIRINQEVFQKLPGRLIFKNIRKKTNIYKIIFHNNLLISKCYYKSSKIRDTTIEQNRLYYFDVNNKIVYPDINLVDYR